MKAKKKLSQKKLNRTIIIGEGAVILLLAVKIAARKLYGASTFTTVLMGIVCVFTFGLIWMILSHRIEKDDELSEVNKMKANLNTFYMMAVLVPFGFLFVVMYNSIAGKPLTLSIDMDSAAEILLLLISVFTFFNSFNFLRLDRDIDGEDEE